MHDSAVPAAGLKAGLIGAAGLMLPLKFTPSKAIAQIPGGSLPPGSIPKYATPLLIPPVMPKAPSGQGKVGPGIDYYEIGVSQFQQQILPPTLPATTVWGYGPAKAKGRVSNRISNAPSLTIEATQGRPVRIKWINELVDANGNYLPHLLPVDPTLHWANPPQGVNPQVNGTGAETRVPPSKPRRAHTPARFRWSPTSTARPACRMTATVTPRPGILPAANNIPAGYAKDGTWYNFFKGKAAKNYGATWEPGSATFQYPNSQRASTIWYHDHTLGMTRLNVYAGPAGFYIIRGGPAGDGAVLDSRSRHPGRAAGPRAQGERQVPA